MRMADPERIGSEGRRIPPPPFHPIKGILLELQNAGSPPSDAGRGIRAPAVVGANRAVLAR